jgi:hypothetical protein
MGQPITVVQKPSPTPGVERFEINRSITGMGHEYFTVDEPVGGDRPADELARRLFERGGIDGVHVNSNVITIDMAKSSDTSGLRELIEELFIYYRPGVEVPSLEG